MSRSGYTDDYDDDPLAVGRWRAVVKSATRGRRGQKFFADLVAALDAMPVKRLIANHLEADGETCVLGALGKARGVELEPLEESVDDMDYATLGDAFDIAEQLAQETMWWNDEAGRHGETPEQRWTRVRAWASRQIRTPEATP